MSRKTRRDVEGMFRRAVASAQAVGIDTTGWELQLGSSTMGHEYALRSTGPGPRLTLGGWSNEHLGMTAGEAYSTLHALALAWEYVEAHGRGADR